MELVKLLGADMYRDGGSFSAEFETNDGTIHSVFLQRSAMPDNEGLHHKWLYQYQGYDKPQNCPPIITGSDEESELLARLQDFLAAQLNVPTTDERQKYHLERLSKMIYYIQHREPCFPYDIKR
jgi:predicted metal-binding protein